MIKGLLIEDDFDGLLRAQRCAPNKETLDTYLRKDIEWTWVKNYNDFCKHITEHGLPDVMAFDHDLGTDAYELWHKHKGYVNSDINYDEYQTKTGYHCAQFLVDYCLDRDLLFTPEIYSHSMNDKGRANILGLLNNLKKHQKIQ